MDLFEFDTRMKLFPISKLVLEADRVVLNLMENNLYAIYEYFILKSFLKFDSRKKKTFQFRQRTRDRHVVYKLKNRQILDTHVWTT